MSSSQPRNTGSEPVAFDISPEVLAATFQLHMEEQTRRINYKPRWVVFAKSEAHLVQTELSHCPLAEWNELLLQPTDIEKKTWDERCPRLLEFDVNNLVEIAPLLALENKHVYAHTYVPKTEDVISLLRFNLPPYQGTPNPFLDGSDVGAKCTKAFHFSTCYDGMLEELLGQYTVLELEEFIRIIPVVIYQKAYVSAEVQKWKSEIMPDCDFIVMDSFSGVVLSALTRDRILARRKTVILILTKFEYPSLWLVADFLVAPRSFVPANKCDRHPNGCIVSAHHMVSVSSALSAAYSSFTFGISFPLATETEVEADK